MRLPLEVAGEVRAAVPDSTPIFVRISATDWAAGGWDLEQSIIFSQRLKDIRIDLIDVSSGGNVQHAHIPVAPNYQVPFAKAIRTQVGIATGAVGLITEPQQAETILQNGEADAIFIAREFLRDPYFPFRAARELDTHLHIPNQYKRAFV
jgi:2,4-dienoyl-CoA reductase-like NADH-dependent reductase (Old Yellow Enzyme family)